LISIAPWGLLHGTGKIDIVWLGPEIDPVVAGVLLLVRPIATKLTTTWLAATKSEKPYSGRSTSTIPVQNAASVWSRHFLTLVLLTVALIAARDLLMGDQVMKMFCILFFATTIWLQDDLQKWTDSSGKFQVDATLISSDGEKVKLRKADGEIIVVEISRLSAASQKFIEKSAAGFEKDYKQKESRLVLAESIESFYKQEVEKRHTEGQIAFIKTRLKEIEPHAKSKAALIDGQFLAPDEISQRRIRCDALVDQWAALVMANLGNRKGIDTRSDTFKHAQKAITEAQKIEPFFRADFKLGIVNVLLTRDFDAAEKHFSECVKRFRKYEPLFAQSIDRLNFSRALGNLALLKIRKNRAKEAAELWTEFLVLNGATPEFSYNVSRVLKANAQGNVDLPPKVIETFAAWNAKEDSRYADRSLGWLYMPYVLGHNNQPENARPKPSENKEAGFMPAGQGTGFIIAPGLILTNKHVVEFDNGVPSDRFRLNWDASTGKEPAYGDLIARSEHNDLALISFPDSTFSGIPIRSDVKTGEEILIIGYPRTDVLGNAITITKGLISKVPTDDQPTIVTDAIANPGNSGGPIIDEYGNAIGVLTWITRTLEQNLSKGEPGAAAIDFVRQHRPDYSPKPLANSRKTVEILEEYKPLILRIETFVSKNRLGELADAIAEKNTDSKNDQRHLYAGHADTACLRCSGSGTAKCLNNQCVRGQLNKSALRQDPIPNAPGRFKTTQVKYKEICPVCSGKGKVPCPGCGGDGEE
jgi:S1-C subfamily serine protease